MRALGYFVLDFIPAFVMFLLLTTVPLYLLNLVLPNLVLPDGKPFPWQIILILGVFVGVTAPLFSRFERGALWKRRVKNNL